MGIEERKQKLGEDIMQSVSTTKKLKDLSNQEIGRLLFIYLWPDMQVFTPQSDLVLEAIGRLGFDPSKEEG